MALVLRVFSLAFVLLLFACQTSEQLLLTEEKEVRHILLKQNGNLITQDNELTKNKIEHKLSLETVTTGSISYTTIIGTDLWIGKLGGAVLRYNLYTKDITEFLDDNYSIRDFSIKKILDTTKDIIILQSDKVIKINKSTEKITTINFPNNISRASNIVKYKSKIYISTLGHGLWEFNKYKNSFLDFIPDIKYISSLLIVKDKLYIGTMNNGLYTYNLKTKKIESRLKYPLELFNINILHLSYRNNILWLGTSKQGLIKWNIQNNVINRLYPKESVSFIYLSNDNSSAVSFIGFGVYIETPNNQNIESIKKTLQTNNVSTVALFEDKLITGNIKKGIITQEIEYLND